MGGGGKGSKAPSAPNYSQAAQQQGIEDRKTAEMTTAANRPTQKNPFGTVSWTKDKNGKWTQTEKWDPKVMAGYNQAFATKDKAMQELANAPKFTAPELAKYDEAYRKQYEQDMYDSVMNRAKPQQEKDMAAFTTKLRQQGLQPGSEAFDRAMQNLMTSQGDVNTKAALDARLSAGDEARKEYASAMAGQNQAYTQADANYSRYWDTAGAANNLLNSQYRPSFSGFSGATGYSPTDIAGATQAQYQAKMGQYSAGQQGKGNIMGAIGSGIGGFMGGK